MSYDINLCDPVTRETLQLDESHHMRGGTYQMGGCPEASLNITYNYSKHYARVFPERYSEHSYARDGKLTGVRSIYGMTGAESIPVLFAAIEQLGDDVDDDYWKATEGNAKRALCQLRALAMLRPDGIWDGD